MYRNSADVGKVTVEWRDLAKLSGEAELWLMDLEMGFLLLPTRGQITVIQVVSTTPSPNCLRVDNVKTLTLYRVQSP
jgi:hypothetical protein